MYYIDGKLLAQRIDDICESRHISKETFCNITGISTATLSHWRTGKYAPSEKNIRILENYFHMPISDFMSIDLNEDPASLYGPQDEATKYRSFIREQPGIRILMDAAQDSTPADIMEAAALLMRRKEERERK